MENKKCFLNPIIFSEGSLQFINSYDGKDYDMWGRECEEMKKIRSELREHYRPEQNNLCSYCRLENPQSHGLSWDVEHIAPKKYFPQYLFEPRNLSLSCKDCNNYKNKKPVVDNGLIKNDAPYPESGDIFNIIHPHYDAYECHIQTTKMDNKYIYKPLSKKGWATYEQCKLSRLATYHSHNINNANVAEALLLRLQELSRSGKIVMSEVDMSLIKDDLSAKPLEIVVETAFKSHFSEEQQEKNGGQSSTNSHNF